ncbi:MAG: RNA polymerase sigma factor [Phycisphaerae bacterium]|nr:RNA polymerase sigma factor [Phycisphaerae bacterium]
MDERQLELLAKAQAGDPAAFDRLLLGLHARLRAHIDRRIPAELARTIHADDVLQDAYVSVFQQLSGFSPRGDDALFAWVVRIAENRLLDVIKAAAAQKRGGDRRRIEGNAPDRDDLAGWLELLAIHERTPSRDAGALEAVELVRSALASLTADQQSALRLRYLDGLPVAEAAQRMQRSEGAVCLLCHRGLQELRQVLGSSGRFFLSGP